MINAYRVFIQPHAIERLAEIYGRRLGIVATQHILDKAREMPARDARYILQDPTLADDRYFLQIDDRARGVIVFELRDNTKEGGHTLVAVHVVP